MFQPSLDHIRLATASDLPAITEIYNDAVLNSVATFDVEPKTATEQERWFQQHTSKLPVWVWDNLTGDPHSILGWASLSPWSDRCAYSQSVEISVYVRAGARRQGIGRKLSQYALHQSEVLGYHAILARIAHENAASVELFRQMDFFLAGTLKEVGWKFQRRHDVLILEKLLKHGVR